MRGIQSNHGARTTRQYAPRKAPRDEPGDVRSHLSDLLSRGKYPEEEVRLRIAMVETVVDDLGSKIPAVRQAALDWVHSEIPGWTFGPEGLAEILDVEPEAIRRALLDQVRRS